MNQKELDFFKKVLLDRRKTLLDGQTDTEGNYDPSAVRGSLSNFPTHLAELASDSFEQDMRMRLQEQNEQQIMDIDAALGKIKDGTYGICEITKKRIEKQRLRAIPWTRYSLEGQEIVESETMPSPPGIRIIWRDPVPNDPDSDEESDSN